LGAEEIEPASKQDDVGIVQHVGAEGVDLECVAIGLLVTQHDSSVPLLNTTGIPAEAAVKYASGSEDLAV